jgi:hypothetical protein
MTMRRSYLNPSRICVTVRRVRTCQCSQILSVSCSSSGSTNGLDILAAGLGVHEQSSCSTVICRVDSERPNNGPGNA